VSNGPGGRGPYSAIPVDDDVDEGVDKTRYAGDNAVVPCGRSKNPEIAGVNRLCELGPRQ
jgi:hypothetical protein